MKLVLKEQAERRQGKIRAITVTNNKTETVRKMTAAMVENKVKAIANNRRFNDQAKKQQGQQNRGNERRQQEDKRPNQAAPRIDFKARAAALKAEQMQNMRVQVRNVSNRLRLPKKPWPKQTNARSQRKSLKKRLS